MIRTTPFVKTANGEPKISRYTVGNPIPEEHMETAVNEILAPTPRKPQVLGLVLHPNELLRKASLLWTSAIKDNVELQNLVDDMIETMKLTGAMGLSAVQVGNLTRLFVIRDERRFLTFINPELKKVDCGTLFEKEGCISFPGVFECVLRDEKVELTGTQLDGTSLTVTLNGMSARAAQHEMDHLNGVLFIDKMSTFKRQAALRDLKINKRKFFKEV